MRFALSRSISIGVGTLSSSSSNRALREGGFGDGPPPPPPVVKMRIWARNAAGAIISGLCLCVWRRATTTTPTTMAPIFLSIQPCNVCIYYVRTSHIERAYYVYML